MDRETVTVAIPTDLSLEDCALEVLVWDEDDPVWSEREMRMVNDDDFVGFVPHDSLTLTEGSAGLELEGRSFRRLDVQGKGKLYNFKLDFD